MPVASRVLVFYLVDFSPPHLQSCCVIGLGVIEVDERVVQLSLSYSERGVPQLG